MKAVRFHGARDIRVEDVAEPTARLGAHDVLIKPITTGICGTDLHEYIAGPIVTPSTPHVYTGATNPQILGHEFSAVVADTGSAVTNVKAGDRVSIQPLISPRDDYFGRRGLYHLSPQMACVGLSWAWGGMGELAIVNDYNVVPVPKGVSDVQAAMIEPAAVAIYGTDRGGVQSGSTVLVSGAGPIGAVVTAIEAAHWLYTEWPSIRSYQDAPKSFSELQEQAGKKRPGYDDHHIVEQGAESREGFPRADIDGAGNIVSIPRYKHHEITGWYATRNAEFGNLSPRDYLRGRGWGEHMKVGRDALRRFKVPK